MKKKWLIGGLVLGGIATVFAARRRGRGGYEDDEIDAAGQGDTFGERDADAPEQRWAPAHTETGVTAEELSMAARVETAWPAIQNVWPSLSLDDIRPAEGDLDRLADRIAGRVSQPRDEVRRRLEGIIEQETPRSSYPAH
jgi:hypothetical protein